MRQWHQWLRLQHWLPGTGVSNSHPEKDGCTASGDYNFSKWGFQNQLTEIGHMYTYVIWTWLYIADMTHVKYIYIWMMKHPSFNNPFSPIFWRRHPVPSFASPVCRTCGVETPFRSTETRVTQCFIRKECLGARWASHVEPFILIYTHTHTHLRTHEFIEYIYIYIHTCMFIPFFAHLIDWYWWMHRYG